MAGPAFVDLLQFVEGDVEVLKFRALDGRQLEEFVVAEVQPFEIWEDILVAEHITGFYFVFSEI